ncbi:hypothetical protein JCM6882_002081 [Rhodosporidiobolus microsporus]
MAPPAALPPPPTLIGKLPVELLKHIVALVREQDKVFKSCSIDSPGPPADSEADDEDDPGEHVDPSRGIFGVWYGYGLHALSLCNKQLRTLALPLLFVSTTAAKLHSLSFRGGEIGDSICRLVTGLSITAYTDESLFSTAAALPRLTNLHTLTLRGTGLPGFIKDPEEDYDDEWRESEDYSKHDALKEQAKMRKMTRTAFFALASRVSGVRIQGATSFSLCQVLDNFAEPSILRELRIEGNASFFVEPSARLAEALKPFSLTELCVEDADFHAGYRPVIHKSWKESLRLPTLTSLTFRLSGNPSEALLLIEAAAPNLTHLHLQHKGHIASFPEAGNPALVLLSLTHLTISGHLCTTAFLPLFAVSPLKVLTFVFEGTTSDRLRLASILPASLFLPPSLRLIRLELNSLNRPSDVHVLQAYLLSRGISLDLVWSPEDALSSLDEPSTAETLSQDEAELYYDGELKTAIKDSIDWARRRIDWLEAMGDKEGIEELGELLRWVRERQVVDSQ